MTDKLRECPFCGGEAFEYYSGNQFEICEVVCKECGCRSKRKTEDEAIAAWNNRKPMDRIVEQLEEEAADCTQIWEEAQDIRAHASLCGINYAIAIVKGVQNENL